MTRASDVIVVGAGLVGAACGREFARNGCNVRIFDGKPPGNHTTAAGMGHIVVMDDSDAQMRLTQRGRVLLQGFVDSVPVTSAERIEAEPTGTLWIAEDSAGYEAARSKQAYYSRFGVVSEMLDERTLREVEPCLARGLVGALRVPDDFVIYAPAVVDALLDDARVHGAHVEQSRVRRISGRNVELEDGRTLDAAWVIDAAGEEAFDVLDAEARAALTHVRLRRRKGQLVITDRYPGFARHQLVELGYLASAHGDDRASVAFNLQPRATGQMLLGSSREFDATDATLDSRLLRQMIERATRFVPGIGALVALRAWAGFRVATDDHLPLVGPIEASHSRGLLLACGHEGLGITTSLSTARLLVDYVFDRADADFPIDPYLPTRRMHAAG
ncbi:MAG: FAD-binding oxidoreductase [Planctomycetes bacterium]|nr:FAD-binding oxidoreductase [Planctomycetota bacterium]MCB9891081.1 FAD-binding oxidoreductase [Planctomycetota bacterium]MCB9916958.1 FAD-binding oxidoreductase [Planctomycetota bacterium]